MQNHFEEEDSQEDPIRLDMDSPRAGTHHIIDDSLVSSRARVGDMEHIEGKRSHKGSFESEVLNLSNTLTPLPVSSEDWNQTTFDTLTDTIASPCHQFELDSLWDSFIDETAVKMVNTPESSGSNGNNGGNGQQPSSQPIRSGAGQNPPTTQASLSYSVFNYPVNQGFTAGSHQPGQTGAQLSTSAAYGQPPVTQPHQLRSGVTSVPLFQPNAALNQQPLPAYPMPQLPASQPQYPVPSPSQPAAATTTSATSHVPVKASQRSTRTRHAWLHRSNMWPTLPDSARLYDPTAPPTTQLHHIAIKLGTGSNSGRNLMARFGNSPTLRTRRALLIERPRPDTKFGAGLHPSGTTPIPAGTSLDEIAANYPLHVWGDGLRLFMAEGWSEEQIWNALPANARLQDAASRPWNYIQAATGREADRIWVEDGHSPRKAQHRKKRDSDGADDGNVKNDGSDNGGSDDGKTSNKRRKISQQTPSQIGYPGVPRMQPLSRPSMQTYQIPSAMPPSNIAPFPVPGSQRPQHPSPFAQAPTNVTSNVMQPMSQQIAQLWVQIDNERRVLNDAHLDYFRQIDARFAQRSVQDQQGYIAGYGQRYLFEYHNQLLNRNVDPVYHQMIPTSGTIRDRELEIFRQIQRATRQHVPTNAAEQNAEDVRALTDMYQRMAGVRRSRERLVRSIHADRQGFANHIQQVRARNSGQPLSNINIQQPSTTPSSSNRPLTRPAPPANIDPALLHGTTPPTVAGPGPRMAQATPPQAVQPMRPNRHFPSHAAPNVLRSDETMEWRFLVLNNANELDRPEIASRYLDVSLQQARAALMNAFVPRHQGETFDSWWAGVLRAGTIFASLHGGNGGS